MKVSLVKILVVVFILPKFGYAQNLVPDPGFEIRTTVNSCRTAVDTGITLHNINSYFRGPKILQHWSSPTYGIPAVVNARCPNSFGNYTVKLPISDSSLGSLRIYNVATNGSVKNSRSYLQTKLLDTLVNGRYYKVSFYVSPSHRKQAYEGSFYSTSSIGAFLSEDRITYFPQPIREDSNVLNVSPQIQNDSNRILSDTSIWYLICGTFKADGGEEWLTLGNFYNDINTKLQPLKLGTDSIVAYHTSYYYIENVTVEPIKNINPSAGRDTVICDTNAFTKTLTARPGASFYHWSTGDTSASITVDSIGTYWLEADYGCGLESDTFKIILQDSLSLQLGGDTTLCETVDSIHISAPLGFNRYRWNTGDTTASIWAKQSGTYTLEAAYLCDTLYDSIQVTFNPKPPPPIVSDTGFCVDDTVLLNAQGQNLLWYDSLQDQSPKTSAPWFYNSSAESKQFWVSQSINNCESDLAQFTVKTEKTTSVFIGSDSILCGADSLEIGQATDSSWKYLWNTGDTTSKINAKNSGTYWLRASNLCNTSSDTIEINFNPIPPPPQVQNLTYCDTVSLNKDSLKVSGQNLIWYKSTSDSLGKLNPTIPQALEAGTYRFFVSQTINSCESEKATFELTILRKPEVDLVSNQTVCEGEVIQLDAYFPTATYQWSTGDTTASITVDIAGVYAVRLSNQCGTAQDSVQIDFENCETKIFVPNIFSPNGDGVNDLFQPEGENFQLTQMLIYNRWGEQVYRTNTPYWDGRISGKKAQIGVYFYLISYKDAIGEQKQLKGTISVVY